MIKKKGIFMDHKKKAPVTALAGMTAALYTVLTVFSALFGLSSGAVQCRLSEALCVLPVFTPASIPGLTVGCFVSNLITGGGLIDGIIGSAATLIGALGAYFLRKGKKRCLSPLPTVAANTFLVPLILCVTGGATAGKGYLFFALTVLIGETVSAYALGILLLRLVEKTGIAEKLK